MFNNTKQPTYLVCSYPGTERDKTKVRSYSSKKEAKRMITEEISNMKPVLADIAHCKDCFKTRLNSDNVWENIDQKIVCKFLHNNETFTNYLTRIGFYPDTVIDLDTWEGYEFTYKDKTFWMMTL